MGRIEVGSGAETLRGRQIERMDRRQNRMDRRQTENVATEPTGEKSKPPQEMDNSKNGETAVIRSARTLLLRKVPCVCGFVGTASDP